MPYKNLSVSPAVAKMIEEGAENEVTTQSNYVEKAVRAYYEESWESQVERRLGEIEAALNDQTSHPRTHSEENNSSAQASTHEKAEGETTNSVPDKITEDLTADELPPGLKGYGYSVEEKTLACAIHVLANAGDKISEVMIEDSIVAVWDSPSDQTVEKYRENVIEYLMNNGWGCVPVENVFYRDQKTWKQQLKAAYKNRKSRVNQLSKTDSSAEIEKLKREFVALGNEAVRAGFAKHEEFENTLQDAKRLEELTAKYGSNDDRETRQRKNRELKSSSIR